MAKRSVTIAGHRTSVSLEAPFWDALTEIARASSVSQASLIADIDRKREPDTNLSAAIRIFVLNWYQRRSAGSDTPT